jgi:glycosyltransferase involved in cell wall biosynthesis
MLWEAPSPLGHRMRIVFIHRTVNDYTVESPFLRGIGGTESALCYASIELAKLGHSVTLLTNASTPGRYRDVECLNYKTSLTPALINAADVVVVSNEACGRTLKDQFRAMRPLVMWNQHADDQPAIEALEFTRERKAWASIAFVSEWQRDQFCSVYWIDREKTRVMRNAISPAFAQTVPAPPWFKTGEPPVLVYTSAPYRGLDVLLDAVPLIRAAIPDMRLRVFSGMATLQVAIENDPYAELYDRCRRTEGVEYIGPVSQPQLAAQLSRAAALAYPSTFPETSCIAAMEAMSAGATILTTRSGAMPETTSGFGMMIEAHDDGPRAAKEFAELAIEALSAARRDPDTADVRRAEQIAFARANYSWPARALEWQSYLSEIARQR